MTNAQFTIRAFASASRLSIKALRLYERLDLLRPARVDGHNGYRYYSAAQLPDAQLIGLLRQLELPLTDIQAVLRSSPETRPEMIRAQWAAVKARQERQDALARYVIHKLRGDPHMTTQHRVQQRFVSAQQVACITRQVYVNDLPQAIQDGFQTLETYISAQASFAGAPFVIYHGEVNADSDGPIEICWPYAGHLTPDGEMVLRVEPAHQEAFVALTREQFEFPGILGAYEATAAYAKAHGQSGPLHCREVYGYDWNNAAPHEPVGDVAWPYLPAESQA